MKCKLVICDLDGTLLDTLEDIYHSVNYALKTNGLEERTLAQVRHDIGDGIKKLIERSIPDGDQNPRFEDTYKTFQKYYPLHIHDYTKPYPKVMEILQKLQQNRLLLAVASNKYNEGTQALINHFFPGIFNVVYGLTPELKRKPDPDMINHIMNELHVNTSEVLIVGDTVNDYATAQSINAKCVIVTYGFRNKEELQTKIKNAPLVDAFDQIINYLF